MTYDGLKFTLEDSTLSIIFTNTGKAFHISGKDTDIAGHVLTITGMSLNLAYALYTSITYASDIELLGLEIWSNSAI